MSLTSWSILLKPTGTGKAAEEIGRKRKRQIFQQDKCKANNETNEVTDNGMNVNEHNAI